MKTEKHAKSIIFQVPSLLWIGNEQHPGTLSLTPKSLLFKMDDVQKKYPNLKFPLENIESVEFLLLFDFSRNGLKIINKDGNFNLFVFDNPETFRWAIMKSIAGL